MQLMVYNFNSVFKPMQINRFLLLTLAVTLTACAALKAKEEFATQHPWHTAKTPTRHKPQIYGGYSAGCIDGAKPLPEKANGYLSVSQESGRIYGHPELITAIEKLGKKIEFHTKKTLLVGDLGHARGGPASLESSAHRSHQNGLDVDIWYELLPKDKTFDSAMQPFSVLDPTGIGLNKKLWTKEQMQILRYAASSSAVERILVNPHVKVAMCQHYRGSSWLNKLRPWWGHDKHFHMRLKCPKGNKHCEPQKPVPDKDECGKELAWWFTKEAMDDGKKEAEKERMYPNLPKQCDAVFAAKG